MRVGEKPSLHVSKRGMQQPQVASTAGTGLFSLFSSELQNKHQELSSYEQDVDFLKATLDAAGETLERSPTLDNFKKFRETLSAISKHVSGEAYRLEKIGGTPTNPRYYEIITIIDKEADKLYELIVKEQKNRIAITAAVIGIKGLVVDLTT